MRRYGLEGACADSRLFCKTFNLRSFSARYKDNPTIVSTLPKKELPAVRTDLMGGWETMHPLGLAVELNSAVVLSEADKDAIADKNNVGNVK